MDAFLRNAGQILETAAEAQAADGLVSPPSEYLIAISREGSIRMMADAAGWSLLALAAEHGASAVYRVTRRPRSVRVEAWSAGRTCVLTRELPGRCYHAASSPGLLTPPSFLSPSLAWP
jgi:hypothetical protein